VRCVGGAGASRVWCRRWVIMVGPGAAPHRGGALVSIPHHHQCPPPFTHPTQPCKQVLAAVGMGGSWRFPFGGVCAWQHDVACVRGMLGPLVPVPRRR
jgi:hypothetical protein